MAGILRDNTQQPPWKKRWFSLRFAFLFIWVVIYPNGIVGQDLSAGEQWLIQLQQIDQSAGPAKQNQEEILKLANQYLDVVGKDSIYARMVSRLGDYYRILGEFDKGLFWLNEAVAINKSGLPAAEESYLVNSYFNMALLHGSADYLTAANQYLDSCIFTIEKHPEKGSAIGRVYELKAFYFFENKDFQRSIDMVDFALSLPEIDKNEVDKAFLLLQKGQALLGLKKIDEAEKNILEGYGILKNHSLGGNSLATLKGILSKLFVGKKRYKMAISHLEDAMEINSQYGFTSSVAGNLSEMGSIYVQFLDNSKKAIECYEKAIDLMDEREEKSILPDLRNNLGYAFARQKDYPQAITHFQAGLSDLNMDFSDTLWQRNPSLEQIIRGSNKYLPSLLLANKGEVLLDLYLEERDEDILKLALSTFKLADKAIDLMRWEHTTQQSKLFWREKAKTMYGKAIEACYYLNDLDYAFYFFEKSKAVLLIDKLNELGAQQFLDEVDLLTEKKISFQLKTLRKNPAFLNENDPEFLNKRTEFNDLLRKYEDFIQGLEIKYPNYYQYKYDTSVVSLLALREEILAPDQTYIGYFEGEEFVYSLAVTHDKSAIYRMPSDELNSKSKELLYLSSDRDRLNRNYSEYLKLAFELYDGLFRPLGIKTSRVIISPDNFLIPFEMLLKENDNPDSFLLHDHAFSYTYSAGYLSKNHEEGSHSTASFLALAPVDFQPHLQQVSLKGSDVSLSKLKKHFSSHQIFTGSEATKTQFLNHLPAHEIVQLYAHAHADDGSAEPTLFFNDSTLNVSELSFLGKLSTKLVVLSACNTGVGKLVPGEGVFSLARGFAAAGIPSSITSLWPIDNKATYQLSEMFYQSLAEGHPTDLALQEAKLRYINENPGIYRLPYFWAAEVMIGNSFVFSAKANNNFLVYIALLIIVLGLIFLKMKRGNFLK
ncbi:CHAT domain-containing protein [Cyclobacterium sp.]|uniref:CHAT domain-containing protein n=1 Tax=Cyclobacterium sp. TaxID=1966343 RepID=UPI0019BE6A71|nr:CHAT domain-containing protein [Cyclobacterium sp.]MBD3626577.1 CHAT domain-containing protein [Cyclobacterium sp.]